MIFGPNKDNMKLRLHVSILLTWFCWSASKPGLLTMIRYEDSAIPLWIIKTFYVANTGFMSTLYCRTLQWRCFLCFCWVGEKIDLRHGILLSPGHILQYSTLFELKGWVQKPLKVYAQIAYCLWPSVSKSFLAMKMGMLAKKKYSSTF